MKASIALATFFGFVGFGSGALAQSIEGAIQVGLGTSFLTYSSTTVDTSTAVAGVSQSEKTKVTRWGISERNGVQLEGGYGLSNSLLLGGILALGGTSTSYSPGGNGNESSYFHLLLAPKIEYLFLPNSVFRPAVGGAIGLSMRNSNYQNAADVTQTGLGLLGRVGGKWFLTPGFSIDPNLFFGFETLTGSTSFNNTNASRDTSSSGYSIGLSLGVSGWVK